MSRSHPTVADISGKTWKIPPGVTKIPVAAYEYGSSLSCVDMKGASDLVYIEKRAFHQSQLLLQVFLPPNLRVVGRQAFKQCGKLHTVDMTDSANLVEIGANAFEGCASLADIHLAPSITTIGDWAFAHCSRLMNVRLPPKLKVIPPCAFFNCPELQNINLESTMVSRIGESAFEECINLHQIGIPSSFLVEIASNAFLGCPSLATVSKMSAAFKLETIGHGAFEGCTSLQGTLDLTGTIVETIQADAFKLCSSLKRVLFNVELIEIESNAFAHCYSLEKVAFRPVGNLKSIGPSAFQQCLSLQALDFPASLESIDCEASNLDSVQFQQGLSCIAEEAFYDCPLRDVTIPSSVDYLMDEAFDVEHLYRIDVDGDRLELAIRLSRMYPDAYVGMPTKKWCYLYCHDDKNFRCVMTEGDKVKLNMVKSDFADKLYKLVLWSVSVGSIGT